MNSVLLVFTEGKDNKRLAGYYFLNAAKNFLRELRKQMPDKFFKLKLSY